MNANMAVPIRSDVDFEEEFRDRAAWPTSVDVEEASRAGSPSPTHAMRARAERNRQRARALRLERAAHDSAGGFLVEAVAEASARAARPVRAEAAPRVDPAARPPCLQCARPIALSYLLDTFQHPVCDDCREAEGAHALVTRTDAKAHYLLEACDLDERGGALPCVRRRNPHARAGDMRLYLRAQLEERARLVWGDEAHLQAERARREAARAASARRREARHLRALRLAARSSLVVAPRAPHRHAFEPETHDAAADTYTRRCACGHRETYEKM